jgi:hypothetical protein
MKLIHLIETLETLDLFDTVKDLMLVLNINKVEKISMKSLLRYFAENGVRIDFNELRPFLDRLEFVHDFNKEFVWFQPESKDNTKEISDADSKQTVKTRALNKAKEDISK